MIRSTIAPKLARNLKLVGEVDTLSKIHDKTKTLTLSICNHSERPEDHEFPHKNPFRDKKPTHFKDTNKPKLGVQYLCNTTLDVMYNKTSFNVLQSQTNSLLQASSNFKIDELLLLLCPYAIYADSYSRWFRVRHSEFSAALRVYNRHLLSTVSDMSIEQVYFMIVLFTKLSKRYEQYALTDLSLLSCLISKLIFFAENIPKPTETKSNNLEKNRFSAEMRSYNSTLQTVYNCYFPYFRMIYTSLDRPRTYTEYLTKSSLHLQQLIHSHLQQHSINGRLGEITNYFNELVKSLNKLADHNHLKLTTITYLIRILSNSGLCDSRLVNKLAISLHSLTVHLYVLTEPTENLDKQSDEPVEDHSVLQNLFTEVLDNLSLSDISMCLESLEKTRHINESLLTLFIPYVVNGLKNAQTKDLVILMNQLTKLNFFHWPVWLLMARGINVSKLAQIKDLNLLTEFYSSLAIQNTYLNSASISRINGLKFVHITDLESESKDKEVGVAEILNKMYGLEGSMESLLNSYVKLMRDLDNYFKVGAVGTLGNSLTLETLTKNKFRQINL
ncbi:uncharacterized protein TA20805 [Theileria annulata]|uniref:Uncharacterized protein n=1 Tax=Theileria annulata TaxID=5874 RepID=Q4UGZ4_THEAN|nr:uncharacterized protein TA20805 [Theileria annulata]CAI73645.1 hypothetical protein TA20805 [Theileria annulata]|eukprot:XP_954322.1 hypothetical protein TA20805 [Theileria annulata]